MATSDMIGKLPKWAQEHISKIESERFVAIRSLNEYLDNQTKSVISYSDYVCTGEQQGPTLKTTYVQSHHVDFEYEGMKLHVMAHGGEVRISYSGDAVIVPKSYKYLALVKSYEALR